MPWPGALPDQAWQAITPCDTLDELLVHLTPSVRLILLTAQAVDHVALRRLRQGLLRAGTDRSLPVVILTAPGDVPLADLGVLLDDVAVPILLPVAAGAVTLPGLLRLAQCQAGDVTRQVLRDPLFESLLELLPVGLVIAHDPQGQQVTMNQPAAQLLALPDGGDGALCPLGSPPAWRFMERGKAVDPQDWPMRQAMRTGQAVRGRAYQLVREDDTCVEVMAYATPLRDGGGAIYGSVTVLVDITRQKQVEAALAESESRLKVAQECARAGAWEWNLATGELIWSPALHTLHDAAPSAMTLERWMATLHPQDAPALREALASRQPFQLEYRLGGSGAAATRWVLASGRIHHDELGRPHRVLGVCMDITDSKLVEQASRANAVQFRTMVDASPLGVFITGPDGRYQYVNAQLCRMAATDDASLRGQGLLPMLPADERAQAQLAWRQALARRQPYERTCRLMPPGQPVIWVHLRAVPVIDDGQLIGYIGKVEDITRQRAAQEQLRLSQSRLRLANATLAQRHEDMEELLSITAHDLKHPVVGIQGLLSLLRDDCYGRLTADERVNLDMALGECDRMKEMLGRLSELGRIEQLQPRLEQASLRDVVDTCVHRHQAHAVERGVVVQAVAPRAVLTLPCAILEEALSNLIDNAIKYGCPSPQRNVIRIEAEHDEQWCSLKVSDSGPGIAPQHRQRVFRPFQRLVNPARQPGSGIGLTAVKRLIQRVGGRIELADTPQPGACFVLRFPHGSPANLSDEPMVEPAAQVVVDP